jgi:prolyl-tRNA editing enzyme YbaK/EbsC (Cys-tRNA(Pro) deacylase)
MAQKTNAVRLLDQVGILYELREYEVDPDDLRILIAPADYFKVTKARLAAIAVPKP